jgi:hypothetical protein
VDCIPDTAPYSGPHGEEQGVAMGEPCETVDFFSHYIDSELIANMKEQIYMPD